MKISEREIAAYALIDIIDEGGYNNIVLRRTLNQYRGISIPSKNMITEIVNGALRNLILIDYIINQFSKTPVLKLKPLIRSILRISIYQIMFMDKVPESAVCNEAVKIAKTKGLAGLSGFVNGVLRSVIRKRDDIKYPDFNENPKEFISVMYSHPGWLVDYWAEFMDISDIKELCKKNNTPPRVSICVNTLKVNADELTKRLEKEGMKVEPGNLTKAALRISKSSDLRNSPSFMEGLFHVMDESSMMAVEAAEPSSDTTFLDLCAAPGGKSFYAAYLMNNTGNINAFDIHDHKIDLIEETRCRLGITNMKIRSQDATVLNERFVNSADSVLLDAPCSGLGLLRKKPDTKFRKTREDIEELALLQRKMLNIASKYPKAGGKLVYSTCTISKLENEDNTEWFLKNYPYTLEHTNCYLPSVHDTDGFFVAAFTRKG